MNYKEELCRAMDWLGQQPDTIFIGQAVACEGTAMSGTLKGVPKEKLIEFPVAEDFQLGASTGLALAGFVPITSFPRWNFLLLATSQLVLHLDKLPIYSNGGYKPRVIIRTAVASPEPLDPQAQHLGDFTDAFASICKNVEFLCLETPSMIVSAYQDAYRREQSTVLVERTHLYA